MLLEKRSLAQRESCFKPIARNLDADEEVTFEATSGVHRHALSEYCGTGLVNATDVLNRSELMKDLDAWNVPVCAWPTDLRLEQLEDDKEAQEDARLAYQKDWVPAAVADCMDVARLAQQADFDIAVVPGAGRFNVSLKQEEQRVETGLVNKEAFNDIETQLEQKLHMRVVNIPEDNLMAMAVKGGSKKRKSLFTFTYNHPLSICERLDRLEERLGMSFSPEHSDVQ